MRHAALRIDAVDLRARLPRISALPSAHNGLVDSHAEAAAHFAANVRRPTLSAFKEPASRQHQLARGPLDLQQPGETGKFGNAVR